jgi:hypothetical protein
LEEPCSYHYDPETKKISGVAAERLTPPKKIRMQKSAENILASIFWDQDGILLIVYLPKGRTINTEYYSSLLEQMKDILREKGRGNVTKIVLFLYELPRLTGHLQPRRNWSTRASISLITHPIPRI